MKKLFTVLFIINMCLSLCACGGTGNEDHDYIISLLEEGRYDMAIHVIEGLRSGLGTQAPAESVPIPDGEPVSSTDGEPVPPILRDMDWIFEMHLINESGQQLSLVSLEIKNLNNGAEQDSYLFPTEELARIGLGGTVLEPGQGFSWTDGHPVVDDFDGRLYIFSFTDPQGNAHDMVFNFDMKGMQLKDLGGGQPQDGSQPTGDWVFPILLENTGNIPIELFAMDITDFKDGQQLGTSIFEGPDLGNIGLENLVIQPGDSFSWVDGHPATTEFNGREYRFHFTDSNGERHTQSFRFDQLDQQNSPIDYSADHGQDLKTLRHGADFELEVYPGVYWVPANALGSSRYTNADIFQMTDASPEDKQQLISTLYEALQLYQVGDFRPSDDNIRMFENGINWEHHKPGYYAVLSNTGCCATDSNWLHYILDSDYDEVGFLATSQRDGGGHVYNYILQDGWYYFIDLTHYHASGSPMHSAVEDGNMSSYRSTDYILGNIHKTRSVEAYVNYVQEHFTDPPGLMFMYSAENVLAVDGVQSGNGIQITYEEADGLDIEVVFDDTGDTLDFARAPSPTQLPDWQAITAK